MSLQTVSSSDGTKIAYSVTGSGSPVLLIHGFPDDHTLWTHQAEALAAAGRQVIAVDQRGYGRSGKPEASDAYRVQQAVADMTAVLDALDLPAAAVVGHDWGSAVASALAMFAPDRVERLVLISAGHPAVFRTLGLRQWELAWYMQFFQTPGIAEQWLAADDWANLRLWGRHPDIDRVIGQLAQPGALTGALNWYRANSRPETMLAPKRALPRLSQPTMGIWGSGDPHLVEEFITGTASLVDGAWRYERIDRAGHWIQLDQPEILSGLLIEFLCVPGAPA